MTAQVVKLRDFSVDQMIDEIHKFFATEQEAGKRCDRARINAGQMLLALRQRLVAGEAGENVNWWKWYKQHFARSRRDAERVMALARTADPDAAAEAERVAVRDQVAEHRRKKTSAAATYVCRDKNSDADPTETEDPVQAALGLVKQMTAKQRRRFFAALRSEYEYPHQEN